MAGMLAYTHDDALTSLVATVSTRLHGPLCAVMSSIKAEVHRPYRIATAPEEDQATVIIHATQKLSDWASNSKDMLAV